MAEKIFITGGLGFIGAWCAKKLLEKGDKVVIYDLVKNFSTGGVPEQYFDNLQQRLKSLKGKAKMIEGDIRDTTRLKRAVVQARPDKVVHFAGLPIADVADDLADEAIAINFAGTANLLQAVGELKPKLKKFINISSSMVYGDFQYVPADENHPIMPKGIYGITKLGAEHLTRFYANRFGFNYITLRPSAVYGPTDCNQRVVQLFIEAAVKHEPIVLHENGAAKLDFTYVDDLVNGVILALKNSRVKNETFNLTFGQGRSLKELAFLVKKYFPKTKLVYKKLPENKRRPRRGALDIKKAEKILGYQPRYNLEKGVAEYLKFLGKI